MKKNMAFTILLLFSTIKSYHPESGLVTNLVKIGNLPPSSYEQQTLYKNAYNTSVSHYQQQQPAEYQKIKTDNGRVFASSLLGSVGGAILGSVLSSDKNTKPVNKIIGALGGAITGAFIEYNEENARIEKEMPGYITAKQQLDAQNAPFINGYAQELYNHSYYQGTMNKALQSAINSINEDSDKIIKVAENTHYFDNFLDNTAHYFYHKKHPLHGINKAVLQTITDLNKIKNAVTQILNKHDQLDPSQRQQLQALLNRTTTMITTLKSYATYIKSDYRFQAEVHQIQQEKIYQQEQERIQAEIRAARQRENAEHAHYHNQVSQLQKEGYTWCFFHQGYCNATCFFKH